MVSLVREGRESAEDQGTHYYRKIGLIKVENRTPYRVPGFSDVPSEGVNQNHLFFTEEWKTVALRPYVRDLRESVKKRGDPFFPLRNNIGWQQYFEDHPLGADYFQELLLELRPRREAWVAAATAQGFPLFRVADIDLAVKLREASDPLSQYFRGKFSKETSRLLDEYDGSIPPSEVLQRALIDELNRLIEGDCLYEKQRFAQVELAEETRTLIEENPQGEVLILLNRWLLEDAYPHEMAKSPPRKLFKKYKDLAKWLENLLECLIRIESWLQHLRYVCRLICGVEERPTLDKPTPSLFNVYNLRAAYLEYFSENSSSSVPQASGSEQSDPGEQKGYVYDVVCDALLDCLTGKKQGAKEELLDLVAKGAKREVEKRIQELCRERAEAMRETLEIKNKPLRIVECLDEGPPDWKFRKVMCEVLDDLDFICKRLEDKKLEEREAEYELISEEVEARRISKVARIILNGDRQGEDQFGVVCSLPPLFSIDLNFQSNLNDNCISKDLRQAFEEKGAQLPESPTISIKEKDSEWLITDENNDNQQRYTVRKEEDRLNVFKLHNEPAATGCKAAQALAAATMYADSFHQIDEKRLIFIANHIVQVLDNHLLYQARQRELELDFGTLNVLGLEHFGLELLDTLYSCYQRIARALGYLLKLEAYRRGEYNLQLQSKLTLPKELVKEVGDFSGDEPLHEVFKTPYQRVVFFRQIFCNRLGIRPLTATASAQEDEVLLVSIEHTSTQRVGTYVLEEIFDRLEEYLHWLKAEPVRDSAGRITKITFLPNENLIPNDGESHAKIVLLENANGNEADKMEKMELFVWLKREDLQAHDLRALWSAVKVLEEVLKVTEATAGGVTYATTTTR